MSMCLRRGSVSRRGFTLTEMAIVMGVIGTILGAVWTAASMVMGNMRVNQANTELTLIAQNIRSLYASRTSFASAAQTDVTCAMVNTGVVPQNMVTQTCVQGNAATYPVNPWGGPVSIFQSTSAPDASATQFEIWFGALGVSVSSIPASACLNLLGQLAGSAQSSGITYLFSGGVGWVSTNPIPDAQNFGDCGGSQSNTSLSTDWQLKPSTGN